MSSSIISAQRLAETALPVTISVSSRAVASVVSQLRWLGLCILHRLHLAAIGALAPRFAVDVDVRVAERGEVAVHRVALVIPFLHLLRAQLGAAGGAGQRIHQVAGRLVEGIHDHVAHGAAQLRGVLELAVLHPAVHGDQVEELDDARGIDLLPAAIAGLHRLLRVAQVHQRHGDLVGAQLLARRTSRARCFTARSTTACRRGEWAISRLACRWRMACWFGLSWSARGPEIAKPVRQGECGLLES